jgi:hypothetical protein
MVLTQTIQRTQGSHSVCSYGIRSIFIPACYYWSCTLIVAKVGCYAIAGSKFTWLKVQLGLVDGAEEFE